MSPATLTPPPVLPAELAPPPVAASGPAGPRLPVRAPLRGGREREGGLRVTRSSVALSLVVHAVLAVLLVLGIDQATRRERQRTRADVAEQVSYIDVAEWPADGSQTGAAAAAAGSTSPAQAVTNAAIDSALARLPELQRFPDHVPTRIPPAPAGNGARGAVPGAQPGAPNGASGGDGNAIGNDAAGGPLGPGYRDRRLIVQPEAVPERQKTDHERYMDHLGSVLQTWNDSVAAEAEHQRRLHNWTVRDKNGREWGLGEGGVPIIAGHRIPVPIAPPIHVDRDQEEAARAEARQRAEIERQADDTDRDRNFRERTRAIRQHQDEERRKRREGSSGQQDGSSSSSPSSSSSSTPSGSR